MRESDLPTEPDTLIEIESDERVVFEGLWLRSPEVRYNPGAWWMQVGTGNFVTAAELARYSASFKVRAVPSKSKETDAGGEL